MYAGRIIEHGTLVDVFESVLHPYTEGLFNSIPNIDDRSEELKPIRGLMPNPADLPSGCPFHPRCPYALKCCSETVPELKNSGGDEEHQCACFLAQNIHLREKDR